MSELRPSAVQAWQNYPQNTVRRSAHQSSKNRSAIDCLVGELLRQGRALSNKNLHISRHGQEFKTDTFNEFKSIQFRQVKPKVIKVARCTSFFTVPAWFLCQTLQIFCTSSRLSEISKMLGWSASKYLCICHAGAIS